MAVFAGQNERFDHLGIREVTAELVQLCQPEVVARVVTVGQIIWITPQVTEVLHQYKRSIKFSAMQIRIFSNCPQYLRTRLRSAGQLIDQLISLLLSPQMGIIGLNRSLLLDHAS